MTGAGTVQTSSPIGFETLYAGYRWDNANSSNVLRQKPIPPATGRDVEQERSARVAEIGEFPELVAVLKGFERPLKTVARSIKERLQNVVSYCTHNITNAVAEGMNSKIMSIKRRVGGFRNRQNFKTAIFFYCGGLSSTHNNPGWTGRIGVSSNFQLLAE